MGGCSTLEFLLHVSGFGGLTKLSMMSITPVAKGVLLVCCGGHCVAIDTVLTESSVDVWRYTRGLCHVGIGL
jgi:hypothetical protein